MMQQGLLEGLDLNTQRWMSQRFFMFFMTWGVFLPYWTGWMVSEKGITVAEASIIMSTGLVARGVSTLFAYPYFSRRMSSKTLLQVMAIGTLLSVLLYIPAESYSSLMIVTISIHIFYPTLMPALDSTASLLLMHNQLQHYGKSRSWGSIGFVVAGLILTLFISWLGDSVILWAMLLGTFVFTALSIMKTPAILAEKPNKSEDQASLKSILKTKNLLLLLVVVMLLQGGHATYYSYGYMYLQHIDTPTMMIGVILNVAVLAEIIFFSKADTMFHKWSVGKLLAFASIGATARWILVFLFPSILIFTFTQVLHALSFAMGHFAFVKWITKNISPSSIPLIQGIYSAVALSWATAAFTLLGGQLFEINPQYAFLGMIVCTLPAAVLSIYLTRKDS